jgi:CelD/BcsL family acetyltransferase involved in cellulose biosynthesis
MGMSGAERGARAPRKRNVRSGAYLRPVVIGPRKVDPDRSNPVGHTSHDAPSVGACEGIGPVRSLRATQVIAEARSLDAVASLWDSLRGGLDSPMLSFAWSQSALETVCAGEDLRVVVHRTGASAALAPLVCDKGMLSVLRVLGVDRMGEPMDFLYTDISALDALAEALRKMRRPLCLEHLLEDSQVIPALRRAYRGRAWIRIDPMNASPYVPLHGGWTEPERMFNAGRRSDFRRAQRRAEKFGEVTYEILSPTPEEVDPLLTEAYEVEARSWKAREGTDLLTDEPLGDFFRRAALRFSERRTLRVCFMRIDGQAVAVQVAVEHGSRFWLLKIGYDEQYARCSPGNLLMLRSIQHAAQRGLHVCEFLGSAEPWTKIWSERTRQRVKIRVYPYNVRGALYFTSDAGKFLRKRLMNLVETWRPPPPQGTPGLPTTQS